MGLILPFPRTRDRAFVLRHANRMAELSHATAENHLAYQLRVQADTMLKRGVAPNITEQHRQALECAIRAELWRMVLTPGAPGGGTA